MNYWWKTLQKIKNEHYKFARSLKYMNWAETKSKSFKKNVKTNVTNLYTQSMYDIKTECCKKNDGYLKKYRTWFEIWLDAKCKEKKELLNRLCIKYMRNRKKCCICGYNGLPFCFQDGSNNIFLVVYARLKYVVG